MTVTLTSELEKFVKEQVQSGRFQSAEDIIAQSLGMLRAQEEFIRSSQSELREQLAVGLDEIRRVRLLTAAMPYSRPVRIYAIANPAHNEPGSLFQKRKPRY